MQFSPRGRRWKHKAHFGERRHIDRFVEADAGATAGHVDGLSWEQPSVGHSGHHRGHHADADRGAQLLHLARDGRAHAQDDDVEEAPEHVHHHRARPVAIPDEEARNGDNAARRC